MLKASPIQIEAARVSNFCQAVAGDLLPAESNVIDGLRQHVEKMQLGYREPLGPRGDDHDEHQDAD